MRAGWWLALAACSGGTEPDAEEVLDVRVETPAPEAGIVDWMSPETTIDAYSDQMLCLYLDPVADDLVADNLDAMQGDYGHHIVVLATRNPKPAGTWEDCSDADQMPDFRPMILPDTPLPEGYAVRIPAGTQPVMQIHYVNPTATPLLVRDVARLHLTDPEGVTKWASTFATNHLSFEIAPGATEEVSFDCEVPEGTEVLLLGGHMHEWGTRFEVGLGADPDNLAQEYLVNPWVPEYRDAPPVSLYFGSPRQMGAGSVLRTTCTFHNTESEPLGFPGEMCSTFGYLGGTDQPWVCEVTE